MYEINKRKSSTDLWHGGQRLLFDLPDDLVLVELEALLVVEVGHGDPDEDEVGVARGRGHRRGRHLAAAAAR